MKRCVLILLFVFSGCSLTPEQHQAIDAAIKGAYAAQLRQDAINAERARLRAANQPRQTNCVVSGANKWDNSRHINCTTY